MPSRADPHSKSQWTAERERPSAGNVAGNMLFLKMTDLLDPAKRILEIGCHKGLLMQKLREQGHHMFGIDKDEEFVAQALGYGSVALAEELPFAPGSFDIVLSFDVFEHIPDSDRHLREVRRVLRPGGFYLVGTPNKWTNVISESIFWARKFGLRHTFGFRRQHCALHDYWQLERRLAHHGFSTRYFDVPVVNQYFKEKIQRRFGRLGLLALKLYNPDRLPLWLRTNFYVAAQRAEPRRAGP